MIYWSSTVLICVMLALSSWSYLFHESTMIGIKELGFPDFFRIQLAILKLMAIAVLLIPAIPIPFKEWAYAGVALFYITAIVAHIAHKDSYLITMVNLFFLVLLAVSNIYLKR